METVSSKYRAEICSERSFGVVFAILFTAVSTYSAFVTKGMAWMVTAPVASVFLILALIRPRWLHVPNLLWFRIGMALNTVAATVVMAIVFFLVMMPVGIIGRLSGRDPLRRRIRPGTVTFWLERHDGRILMKKQF